jgi:hypothetical protein
MNSTSVSPVSGHIAWPGSTRQTIDGMWGSREPPLGPGIQRTPFSFRVALLSAIWRRQQPRQMLGSGRDWREVSATLMVDPCRLALPPFPYPLLSILVPDSYCTVFPWVRSIDRLTDLGRAGIKPSITYSRPSVQFIHALELSPSITNSQV